MLDWSWDVGGRYIPQGQAEAPRRGFDADDSGAHFLALSHGVAWIYQGPFPKFRDMDQALQPAFETDEGAELDDVGDNPFNDLTYPESFLDRQPGIGLQIVPEKSEYRVGDKARYLVKNPFPGAKALITIERYGVMKSWVETFADSTQVVEFEVEPDFVPGFYLSVSVMSFFDAIALARAKFTLVNVAWYLSTLGFKFIASRIVS